jgi:hypothetical protein
MTIHQCPKCELRFDWKTELDDHCWHDHPEFRHEYPASVLPRAAVAAVADHVEAPPGKGVRRLRASSLIEWLVPPQAGKRADVQHHDET